MATRYNITSEQYKPMIWFEEEVFANAMDDFFAKDQWTIPNTIRVLPLSIYSDLIK